MLQRKRFWLLLVSALTLLATSLTAINRSSAAEMGDILAFSLNCPQVATSKDDPIVFPGQSGAAHLHYFFGNTSTNASTTTASLLQHNSSCQKGWSNVDRSAYWIPALLKNGQPVKPRGGIVFTAYYRRFGGTNGPKVNPIPVGLRMIAGSPKATSYNPDFHEWGCRGAEHEIQTDGKHFPTCPAGTMLKVEQGFPSCWDGKNLDSADHKSHMAYANNGDGDFKCPASHPVMLPELTVEIAYPGVNGDMSAYSLSSGAAPSMHADFFAGWDPNAQRAWINKCMRTTVFCEGLNRSSIQFAPTAFNINAIARDPKQASKAPPTPTMSSMPGTPSRPL